MKNKIKNISIKFLTVTKTEETYRLFKPFLVDRYDEIFFIELILDGDNFTLYISSDKDLIRVYDLLEELNKSMIIYELIVSEPEWDDDMGYSFYNRRKITVDEFKKSDIEYREVKELNRGFNFAINDFALSFDGKYIATATERNIFIWCAKTYRCLAHHIVEDGTAQKVYFTSDFKYLVTLINDMATWHDTIQVWKPLDKNLTQCEWIEEDDFYLEYSKSEMKKLSPSLPYLFSSLVSSCYGSDYNFYREFYSLNFTYKAVYHKKSLALYGMDRTLINKIKLRPFSSVKALTFSNDSRYICLGQEEDIEIFDTKELKQLKILKSHEKKITALATSADNRYLVSTALDQTLKLWSLENFELITTIESGFTQKITAVSFSMDSTQILVSSQEGIKVWDVKTKEALFHLFNDEEFWCLLDGEEELIEKGVIRDEIAKVTKSC